MENSGNGESAVSASSSDQAVTQGDYTWDPTTQSWNIQGKSGESVYFDGAHHVYKDKDGTLMFWDTTKNAWFPKIDDDFLAVYQMNYGTDTSSATLSSSLETPALSVPGPASEPGSAQLGSVTQGNKVDESDEPSPKPKNKRKDPEWFEVDDRSNTKMYVSNLPLDLTPEEFIEFMSKCGMVAKSDGKNYNFKMYNDSNGVFKGDALCTYIKIESVDLALQLLDGSYLKDKQVKVERAKFTLKGEYDPSKKPRPKKKKDKEKAKKQQERLFSWKLDPLRNVKEEKKNERIVIVSNAFDPADFEGEKVADIIEYSQDFRDEASKCGTVTRLVVHDRHPDGVVQISMSNSDEATAVINLFNNRFFGGKQIKACIWDGVTKYHVQETEEEKAKREKQWVESLQE